VAYSDFTLPEVTKRFQVLFEEQQDCFSQVAAVEPSEMLRAILRENTPLALAIQTEKARSELIIAPILVEVRRQMAHQISLFSGVDFTVDPAQGLNGVCDFLISATPEQLYIKAPVAVIVEAKNENIKAGLAQCSAAMIAAQRFNDRENTGLPTVFGVVTTGNIWKFLKLTAMTIAIDQAEYYIDNVGAILGILLSMVNQLEAA